MKKYTTLALALLLLTPCKIFSMENEYNKNEKRKNTTSKLTYNPQNIDAYSKEAYSKEAYNKEDPKEYTDTLSLLIGHSCTLENGTIKKLLINISQNCYSDKDKKYKTINEEVVRKAFESKWALIFDETIETISNGKTPDETIASIIVKYIEQYVNNNIQPHIEQNAFIDKGPSLLTYNSSIEKVDNYSKRKDIEKYYNEKSNKNVYTISLRNTSQSTVAE